MPCGARSDDNGECPTRHGLAPKLNRATGLKKKASVAVVAGRAEPHRRSATASVRGDRFDAVAPASRRHQARSGPRARDRPRPDRTASRGLGRGRSASRPAGRAREPLRGWESRCGVRAPPASSAPIPPKRTNPFASTPLKITRSSPDSKTSGQPSATTTMENVRPSRWRTPNPLRAFLDGGAGVPGSAPGRRRRRSRSRRRSSPCCDPSPRRPSRGCATRQSCAVGRSPRSRRERGVETDRRVRLAMIVVDGLRNSDDRESVIGMESAADAKRSLATDRHDARPAAVPCSSGSLDAALDPTGIDPSRAENRARRATGCPRPRRSPSGSNRPSWGPRQPSRTPTISRAASQQRRITARMAAFSPGQSPPPVSTATARSPAS